MIILTIMTGVITGICSGLLGIGGGAIMVVLAISILHVSQQGAQGAALAAIIPTSITGAIKHHNNGLINHKIGIYLAIGGVVGSFFGAYLANIFDEIILNKVFSVFFALIGIQLFLSSFKTQVIENKTNINMEVAK